MNDDELKTYAERLATTAAAIDVERMQLIEERRSKIQAFMVELQQLSEKHGMTFKHNHEELDLYHNGELISEDIYLDRFSFRPYMPFIPSATGPQLTTTYPRGDLSKMSESLKQAYLQPMIAALNTESTMEKLFKKGNK